MSEKRYRGHRHDCDMLKCYCRPYVRYLTLDDLGREFDAAVLGVLNEPENKPALQQAFLGLVDDLLRPRVRELLRDIAKTDRQKLIDWLLDLLGPALEEVFVVREEGDAPAPRKEGVDHG